MYIFLSNSDLVVIDHCKRSAYLLSEHSLFIRIWIPIYSSKLNTALTHAAKRLGKLLAQAAELGSIV